MGYVLTNVDASGEFRDHYERQLNVEQAIYSEQAIYTSYYLHTCDVCKLGCVNPSERLCLLKYILRSVTMLYLTGSK